MKKFLLFTLVFIVILSSVPCFAASYYITVIIDGEELVPKDINGNIVRPILVNGTTYLPVRAVSGALNLEIAWDDETKSVFINGTPKNPAKSKAVNIYIKGVKFIPRDVNKNVVNPILKDGTTFLPVRAISEAFNKTVSWEQETHTVLLSTPPSYIFSPGKTYAFVNKASGKAISLTDSGLVLEPFNNYTNQGFKLTEADDGFYFVTADNDKNFDVNGNSKNPGAKIITYNKGTADNQKFFFKKTDDGYSIYSMSSRLPIEDSAGIVKQNTERESLVQKWDIIEFTPVERIDEKVYYTISLGDYSLYSTDNLAYGYIKDNPDALCWALTPNEDGEYIITSKNTSKSLDVANNSKTSGDPIIVYSTSGDANQRWTFEKQADGTYLIKSVHSGLYLSIGTDNTPIHAELNKSLKQNWTLNSVK